MVSPPSNRKELGQSSTEKMHPGSITTVYGYKALALSQRRRPPTGTAMRRVGRRADEELIQDPIRPGTLKVFTVMTCSDLHSAVLPKHNTERRCGPLWIHMSFHTVSKEIFYLDFVTEYTIHKILHMKKISNLLLNQGLSIYLRSIQ